MCFVCMCCMCCMYFNFILFFYLFIYFNFYYIIIIIIAQRHTPQDTGVHHCGSSRAASTAPGSPQIPRSPIYNSSKFHAEKIILYVFYLIIFIQNILVDSIGLPDQVSTEHPPIPSRVQLCVTPWYLPLTSLIISSHEIGRASCRERV